MGAYSIEVGNRTDQWPISLKKGGEEKREVISLPLTSIQGW
jgi:hypothetical protein